MGMLMGLWELADSHKRARCTLRFMHQFLRCPQQHGRGALVSRLPAKSQEDHTLNGPRFYWENPPATGRDQPAASSQSQRRQLISDSNKYRARNTQTSSRYTHPRPDPVGGNCHTCYVGKWTAEKPGGLPFAFPTPNRSGFVCMPELRASRPHGGGPERQARGLEFEADHDMGQAPS